MYYKTSYMYLILRMRVDQSINIKWDTSKASFADLLKCTGNLYIQFKNPKAINMNDEMT